MIHLTSTTPLIDIARHVLLLLLLRLFQPDLTSIFEYAGYPDMYAV